MDFTYIVDKLLNMNPDPIPKFVLLKEFKGSRPDNLEYQNAYDQVCNHPFVSRIVESQNERGFWHPFHGYTEATIRSLLSYGLDISHACLQKVSEYLIKVLHGSEGWDQFEKQDNARWWPETFVPLVSSAMLSLIDNTNGHLDEHRKRWASFAEASLRGYNSSSETDVGATGKHSNFFSDSAKKKGYDYEIDKKVQNGHFGFNTTRIITPWNYYNLLLLSPHDDRQYLSDDTDRALVDYCMNEADFIYYIYNKNPGEMVSADTQKKDSRDFCHWVRALSLIAQFKGWTIYEQKYINWIMEQRNQDGLWEFPKKFDLFALSNSWRANNRAIDSTIYLLRLLLRKQAF